MILLLLTIGCPKQKTYMIGIDNVEFFNTHVDMYVYFGRPTCIDCRNFEKYLLDVLSENNVEIFYFNTDYWRDKEGAQEIFSEFEIDTVPQLINIDSEGNIRRYYFNEKTDLKDSLEQFLKVGDLKMVRYLGFAEYICLAISICNFIAVGFALKKKRPIFKIMYLINIFGVVVISNLIVWMEGWYVDEHNLSGSPVTFVLNVCNIVLFIVSSIIAFNCKKAE